MKKSTSAIYPLLLTGTIDTAVFANNNVVLTDTQERLTQYLEVINRFLLESPFNPIVFAENSGYTFPIEEISRAAETAKKQFEYIYIETSVENTANFGKSYGEAVLITQAIQRSKLLQGHPYVYKITGRVFLENSEKICKTAENGNSEFITIRDRGACQTVFFKLLRKDYEKGFECLPKYCDEKNGMDAEHAVYKLMQDNGIHVDCFRVYPRLNGICGTNGGAYDKTRRNLRIKDWMIRLGMFRDGKLNVFQRILYRYLASYRQDWFW